MKLKSIYSRNRSTLQFLYHSNINTAKSNILFNSMPKSGTHFFKALLLGMGYRFCGHIGAANPLKVSLVNEGNNFFTAHTREDFYGGRKFLTVRDPLSMTLSQAHYIKKRPDHFKHILYKKLSLEDSMLSILEGGTNINPLLFRYSSMFDWVKRNDAQILDFDDFKNKPQLMQKVLDNSFFDENEVFKQLDGWSPTKRTADRKKEIDFLSEFNEKYQHY